jgi:hypothetical protein
VVNNQKKEKKNEWKVCTLKLLSSKTRRMKEWKFAHQSFCCHHQQQQQKGRKNEKFAH